MNIVYVVVYSSSITFSFEMFGFDTVDRYLCKPRKLVTSGPNRASLLADFLHSGDPSLRAGSIRIMCVSWCQLDSPWSFENTKNTIEWKFLAIFDLLLLINSFLEQRTQSNLVDKNSNEQRRQPTFGAGTMQGYSVVSPRCRGGVGGWAATWTSSTTWRDCAGKTAVRCARSVWTTTQDFLMLSLLGVQREEVPSRINCGDATINDPYDAIRPWETSNLPDQTWSNRSLKQFCTA